MNPQSPADPSSLPQRYAERHRVATHQAELIDRKNPMFILLRTALFCAGAVALLAGYSNVAPATVWQWLGWLCLAAFFIAVVWHENLKEKSELAKFIAATYQWLLDRTERNWSALKSRQIPVIIDKSPLSDDLDLRGPNSLLNWLSLAQTQDGHRTMENWMLEVPSATEMVRRQEAVKALEPLHDMRESFVIESRTLQHAADERMRLREWASEVPWLVQRPWFLLVRLIGPLAFIIGAGMVLVARQADSEQMFRVSAWCMLAGIAWNLASTIIWGGQVHEGFMKLSGGYHDTRHYLRLFELMRGLPQSSPGSILHTLRQHSVEGPESAVAGFIALNRLTRFTSLHRTPTTF